MRVPAADELFRPTVVPDDAAIDSPDAQPSDHLETEPDSNVQPDIDSDSGQPATSSRKPSGRIRHDEKMTVYVTEDELLDIEHARLTLRRYQGIAVDRGRLVREAVALVLADLDAHGDDSAIVARLTQR